MLHKFRSAASTMEKEENNIKQDTASIDDFSLLRGGRMKDDRRAAKNSGYSEKETTVTINFPVRPMY